MAEKKKKGERDQASSVEGLFKSFANMGITVVDRIEKVQKVPTGILSLDLIFEGGLPVGRMIQHFGSEGSGKSTTWMLIARELMRRELPVLWFDTERTLERGYAERLGLDVDAVDSKGRKLLTVVKPETAEQGIDATIMALELKYHKLIVWDTLAKMVPASELGSSVGKAEMGVSPRLFSRATRVWGKALDESGAILAILNQERVDLGAYGAPTTSTGGKAITKHEPSITIQSGKNENEYDAGHPTKYRFNWRVTKTKVFEPNPISALADYYELHIRCGDVFEVDYPHELFNAALWLGLMRDKEGKPWTKLGAFFEGELIATGKEKVEAWFDTESPLRDRIELEILKSIKDGNYVRSGVTQEVHDPDAGGTVPGGQELETEADAYGRD